MASYPFDDSASHQQQGLYSKSEDDGLFRYLALVYSQNHPTMRLGKPNCTDAMQETFKDGITNGADWYDVPGKMVPLALFISSMCCDAQPEHVSACSKVVVVVSCGNSAG